MAVNSMLCMRSTRPIIWPTRPKPAIMTWCSWSGMASYSRLGLLLANKGSPIFSSNKNASGVSAMEIVTIRFRVLASSGRKTFWAVATLNKTKANSPPWASVTPSLILVGQRLPDIFAMAVMTPNLIAINAIAQPMIKIGFAKISLTSVSMPTDMKNKPSSNPLNGSILASSSWRYSESASSTPVKKAPNAMDKPIWPIKIDTPITINSATAVSSSDAPLEATNLKKGRTT